MLAAGKIAQLAIGDPSIRKTTAVYTTSPVLRQHHRMSEIQPFGTRGGFATRHYFPVDGEYEFRITLERTHGDAIKGLQNRNRLEVRLDRARVAEFLVGADGQREAWSGVFNLTPYERDADDDLRVRIPVAAGMREVALSFFRGSAIAEGVLEPVSGAETYHYAGDRDAPMAVWIAEIEGPFDPAAPAADAVTPSRARIFTCTPDGPAAEPACAAQILGAIARRAFRRPIGEGDVEALMGFYEVGRAGGADFESGIEFALRAILVDPEFLFRVEADPPGTAPGAPYRISDIELASRLSFFLWSSIPDDELLDRAAAGELRDPGVLRAQVRRMLADPKSDALVDNFAGQWLFLRNMRSVKPDPIAFPEFDGNLREAFQRETELWFESQVREDRSVLEVLTSDYTFVNARLADHYGIPGVRGNHFRRVTIPDGTRRRHSRPGERPDRHVVRQPHVAGEARRLGPREPARRAAAAAAGRRAGARGFRFGGRPFRSREPAPIGARADGAASYRPGLRELPRAHGPARVRARRLRRRRRLPGAAGGCRPPARCRADAS